MYPLVFSPIPCFSQDLYPFASRRLYFAACLSASSCVPHQPISCTAVSFNALCATFPHFSGLSTILSVRTVRLCILASQPWTVYRTFFIHPFFSHVAEFPTLEHVSYAPPLVIFLTLYCPTSRPASFPLLSKRSRSISSSVKFILPFPAGIDLFLLEHFL